MRPDACRCRVCPGAPWCHRGPPSAISCTPTPWAALLATGARFERVHWVQGHDVPRPEREVVVVDGGNVAGLWGWLQDLESGRPPNLWLRRGKLDATPATVPPPCRWERLTLEAWVGLQGLVAPTKDWLRAVCVPAPGEKQHGAVCLRLTAPIAEYVLGLLTAEVQPWAAGDRWELNVTLFAAVDDGAGWATFANALAAWVTDENGWDRGTVHLAYRPAVWTTPASAARLVCVTGRDASLPPTLTWKVRKAVQLGRLTVRRPAHVPLRPLLG